MAHSNGPRSAIRILPFSTSVNNGLMLLSCVRFVSSARHFSEISWRCARSSAVANGRLHQRQQPEALAFTVNGKNFTKIGERSAAIAALRAKNNKKNCRNCNINY